jgi:hypothetical protein
VVEVAVVIINTYHSRRDRDRDAMQEATEEDAQWMAEEPTHTAASLKADQAKLTLKQESAMNSPAAHEIRSQLTAYYSIHAPANLENIDALVARVVGGPPSEVGGMMLGGVLWEKWELYAKIESKYGHPVVANEDAQSETEEFDVPEAAVPEGHADLLQAAVPQGVSGAPPLEAPLPSKMEGVGLIAVLGLGMTVVVSAALYWLSQGQTGSNNSGSDSSVATVQEVPRIMMTGSNPLALAMKR